MKPYKYYIILIVAVICSWLIGQRWGRYQLHDKLLAVSFHRESGMVTAYLYYVDTKGRRIKDGVCYEFTTDLSHACKLYYKNNVLFGTSTRYFHAEIPDDFFDEP